MATSTCSAGAETAGGSQVIRPFAAPPSVARPGNTSPTSQLQTVRPTFFPVRLAATEHDVSADLDKTCEIRWFAVANLVPDGTLTGYKLLKLL